MVLMVTRWQLFLPPKWRNAPVLNEQGIVDQNLTLVHITHNTAVIQLHQCIAYLSAQMALAGLHHHAVVPTNQQEHSESTIHLLPFTAGRVLLAHSTYHSLLLHPALEAIGMSLDDITRRWAGIRDPASAEIPVNLASRFASRLEQAKHNVLCAEDPKCQHLALDIQQPVYSGLAEVDDAAHSNGTLNHHQAAEHQGGQEQPAMLDSSYTPDSISRVSVVTNVV